MFKSATIFRIASDFTLPPLQVLEDALQAAQFMPCAPTQAESVGWIPPRGKQSTVLAEPVGRGVILRLQTERRVVPAHAVNSLVDSFVDQLMQATGRERISAKIKKEFKEEAIQTLLPRAFPKSSAVTLWIDPVNHWMVVDSGNVADADKIVGYLVEALSTVPHALMIGIQARPVQTQNSPSSAMAHWLATRDAPFNFTLDRDCEMKMPDDMKSTVRYSRHTLEINEVADHIAAGKVPTKLAITWDDRVSFELSDTGQLRKVKMLDVVLDGQQEAGKDDDSFDADAAIVTGELSALIPDLIDALGGEIVEGGANPLKLSEPPAGMPPIDGENDPMYVQALDLVMKHKKPSIALVQRHLVIGYNRAARLIERMEVEGKVSPMTRDGVRKILIA